MKKIFIITTILIVSGCSSNSGYKQYYSEYSNVEDRLSNGSLMFIPLKNEDPNLIKVSDAFKTTHSWIEKGYGVLGASSFIGVHENKKYIFKQAKTVKATDVIYSVNYERQGISSSCGGQPCGTHSYGIYSQKAVFLAKHTPEVLNNLYNNTYRIGLIFSDLSKDEKRKNEVNNAAKANTVYDGSPAFNANIFRGDIITSINGSTISDKDDANAKIKLYAYSERFIPISIIRDGKKIDVIIDTHSESKEWKSWEKQ